VSGHGLESVPVPLNAGDTTIGLFSPLHAAAFLDIRTLRQNSALGTYFASQHGVFEVGATMDPAHPSGAMAMIVPKSFDALVYIPRSTSTVSAVDAREMKREIRENGADWDLFGLAFDDVNVSTTATGATMTNSDALNVSPAYLVRRFSAKPYAGKTIAVTGEIRNGNLLGFVSPFVQATAAGGSTLTMANEKALDVQKTGGWTPTTQRFKVPENAAFVEAGFIAEGFGSVEIRDLRISATP
jgi:hypothetical protein